MRGLHYEEKQVVRALQEYDKLQAIEQQESRMVSQVPFLFTELDRDIAEGGLVSFRRPFFQFGEA